MKELYGEYTPGKKIFFGNSNSKSVFETEDYLLHFYGRFNNFDELKKDFKLRGSVNEEIIIELFKRFNAEKAIQILDGAFAFGLFDKKAGRLFLTRDRMAHVPLYYTILNNRTIFSTSINEILKNNNIKRKFDIAGVLINLASNKWTNPERTHINGIYAIEHGTYLECNEHALYKKSYHCYYTDVKYTEDELLREFDKSFKKTIAKNVNAYKNLSASLSGGLDSSLVVQSILNQFAEVSQQNNLKAYTIKYSGEKEHRDLKYARLLAYEKNVPLEEVVLSEKDFNLQKIDQLLLTTQQIPFDPTSMGDLLIREKAKHDGHNVLLTGNGSDEMWGGYGGVCQSGIFDNMDLNLDVIVKSYLNMAFFGNKWNEVIHDIANSALRETTQKHLIDHLKDDKYNALAIYAIKTILNYNNTQEYHFSKALDIDVIMPFIGSNTLGLLPFTTSGSSKIKNGAAKYFIRKYAQTQGLTSKIINRHKFPYPDPKDPNGSINLKIRQLCNENWNLIICSPIINTIINSKYLKNSQSQNFNYRELWLLLMLWRIEELFKLDVDFHTKSSQHLKMPYVSNFLSIPKTLQNHILINKQQKFQMEDISL